jgi:glycosyltransferase involved in cell wall biosynthesis
MRPEFAPARLFTFHGTVVYVDPSSGLLRHGPPETSPPNIVLTAQAKDDRVVRSARLVARDGSVETQVSCSPAECRAFPNESSSAALDVIPLERGLFGLRCEGLFLCAEPGGALTLSREVCSIWEAFIASETWCSAASWAAEVEPPIARRMIKEASISPALRAASGIQPKNRKILVYGYPKWSHGRVYYDLSKQLYPQGYTIDILNWMEDNSGQIHELMNYYDFIVTAPDGVSSLMNSFGILPDRIVVISHHEFDLMMLVEQKGVEIFETFAGFGVVSEVLYTAAKMRGIRREPVVTPLAVDCAEFRMAPPEQLRTVGYASSMAVQTYGVEWKRGHLAEAAARQAGLPFKVAGSTADQISFHDMPEFYRGVDALLFSSLIESGPLTVMEAAAAGRLVIGTPVGHFPRKAYDGAGILAPIEPAKYVSFVAETLRAYATDPHRLKDKCAEIQMCAQQHDWAHVRSDWEGFLSSVAC